MSYAGENFDRARIALSGKGTAHERLIHALDDINSVKGQRHTFPDDETFEACNDFMAPFSVMKSGDTKRTVEMRVGELSKEEVNLYSDKIRELAKWIDGID
jgi:hypothetical protein